jgi:hypothetical protein
VTIVIIGMAVPEVPGVALALGPFFEPQALKLSAVSSNPSARLAACVPRPLRSNM